MVQDSNHKYEKGVLTTATNMTTTQHNTAEAFLKNNYASTNVMLKATGLLEEVLSAMEEYRSIGERALKDKIRKEFDDAGGTVSGHYLQSKGLI